MTLELTISLLTRLVTLDGQSVLLDGHLAALVGAKEESTSLLRNFYKVSVDVDMFYNISFYIYCCL